MSDWSRTRLDSLTGLRFVAAMLVVMYHTSVTLLPEMRPMVSMGQTGVTFFFLLSGFVLAWSMNPRMTKRQFYWRRFSRVWPLHALTMLCAVVLIQLTDGRQSVGQFFASLFLVQSWHPDTNWAYAYNGVSWSLSCEAFFYAAFPFLAIWLSRLPARRLLLIAIAAFLAAAFVLCALLLVLPRFDWGAVFYTFPAYRISEFVVGVCLAIALRKGWVPPFGTGVAAAVAICSVVLLELLAAIVPWQIAPALASTLCIPGFALMICAYASSDCTGVATLARAGFMVKLGEWSFALYLVHELVLRVAVALGPDSFTERCTAAVLAIFSSILLSGLLYSAFERPVEGRLRNMKVGVAPVANAPASAEVTIK